MPADTLSERIERTFSGKAPAGVTSTPYARALREVQSKINTLGLKAEQMDCLLDCASDTLGESFTYNDETARAMDRIDAMIDGAAAMARDLARMLDELQDGLVEAAQQC